MAEAESAGILCLHIVEEVLVFLVARTENNKLHILSVHELLKTHSDEVKTLVGNKTGNHTYERRLPALLETESLLESLLADALAAHILLGVVAVELIVGGGIVAREVDTVLDTAELVVTEIELVMQAPAVPGILNFSGIARRNGRNTGRGLDRALHHVELAVHLEDIALACGNTYALGVDFPAILTLILDVVDGEEALDVVIPGSVRIEQIVVYGYKSGLPVVGVNDIGMEVDIGQHLEDRA